MRLSMDMRVGVVPWLWWDDDEHDDEHDDGDVIDNAKQDGDYDDENYEGDLNQYSSIALSQPSSSSLSFFSSSWP